MDRADRIARLGMIPELEWRVRAVVNNDLKGLATALEQELNSARVDRFHLAMMLERPEKDGLVLIFHRSLPMPSEEAGLPDATNQSAN